MQAHFPARRTMGCAGSKAANASKPAPGSVDLRGQSSKEQLDAAAQVIQAAALAAGAGEEPAPAPSAAELQPEVRQMSPEELQQMFNQLDRDHDGKLSKSDLTTVEKLTPKEIDEVFTEVQPEDGTVSFAEFSKAMNVPLLPCPSPRAFPAFGATHARWPRLRSLRRRPRLCSSATASAGRRPPRAARATCMQGSRTAATTRPSGRSRQSTRTRSSTLRAWRRARPAAPPRPSKAFASAVAPTHDPFLSDACVPYAIGARWQSVARDLEKHIGCGRTVCSDRVQPSDVCRSVGQTSALLSSGVALICHSCVRAPVSAQLPDYFTREAGVAWDSFPSDDPNIKVRIDAVKDKHVVFLLNCESNESVRCAPAAMPPFGATRALLLTP